LFYSYLCKIKTAFVKGEVLLTVHPIRDHHR
jgi:hypothetical protein